MNNVYRILDANFNRVREGLRVGEDYARFVLDSPSLTAKLKTLRHSLLAAEKLLTVNNAVATTSISLLCAARDTGGDCGTTLKTLTENSRADCRAVVVANLKRAQEGLRVISEYSKITHAAVAEIAEKIRYDLYELEPQLLRGGDLRASLNAARLYVLITTQLCRADPLTVCREAVAGGADIIQLREKFMEDGEFYKLAAAMREICGASTLFIINDRPQIAQLVNADGVHAGQGDLPLNLMRRLLGTEKIIGQSTSAPDYAMRASAEQADYIGVGPVYPTNTKQHRAAVGLEYVQWAAQNVDVPFFAIGSINRETLAAVLAAGARRVAVCTAIIAAPDVAATTAEFKQQIIRS